MLSTTIAAQMYSVREFCKTPADIAASVKKLAEIGYGAVQASGLGPIAPAELKKILDDNGVKCIATHTNTDRVQKDLAGLIAEHKALDCKYTAVGAMPESYRSAEGMVKYAQLMDKAGTAMRAEGVWLGYHNHSFEFEKYNGKLAMDLFYDNTSRENVFAEIDTYWVQHGGGDPANWIRRFRNGMPVVHFKDFGILKDKQVMLEVGEGNLNWGDIITACREANVQYFAVEQDECNGLNPFDCLATSLRNLRNMGLK